MLEALTKPLIFHLPLILSFLPLLRFFFLFLSKEKLLRNCFLSLPCLFHCLASAVIYQSFIEGQPASRFFTQIWSFSLRDSTFLCFVVLIILSGFTSEGNFSAENVWPFSSFLVTSVHENNRFVKLWLHNNIKKIYLMKPNCLISQEIFKMCSLCVIISVCSFQWIKWDYAILMKMFTKVTS